MMKDHQIDGLRRALECGDVPAALVPVVTAALEEVDDWRRWLWPGIVQIVTARDAAMVDEISQLRARCWDDSDIPF